MSFRVARAFRSRSSMAAGSGMAEPAALLSISFGVSWSCDRPDEILPAMQGLSNE